MLTTTNLIILILGGFVAVLSIVAVVFWWINGMLKSQTVHVTKVLAHIREPNLGSAYYAMSEGFRELVTRREFEDYVWQNPTLEHNVAADINRITTSNNQGRADGTITGRDGSVLSVTFFLGLENDQWLPLGIKIHSKIIGADFSDLIAPTKS